MVPGEAVDTEDGQAGAEEVDTEEAMEVVEAVDTGVDKSLK